MPIDIGIGGADILHVHGVVVAGLFRPDQRVAPHLHCPLGITQVIWARLHLTVNVVAAFDGFVVFH